MTYYILSYHLVLLPPPCFFFFFNDTATTEIYTLSLHDALPISTAGAARCQSRRPISIAAEGFDDLHSHVGMKVVKPFSSEDRKSTRLNSSHSQISYAVFCLKKKKNKKVIYTS